LTVGVVRHAYGALGIDYSEFENAGAYRSSFVLKMLRENESIMKGRAGQVGAGPHVESGKDKFLRGQGRH
jgi:hypothetical protein